MDRKVRRILVGRALMFLGSLSEAVGRVLGHPYRLNYTQVERIILEEGKEPNRGAPHGGSAMGFSPPSALRGFPFPQLADGMLLR